MQENSVQSPFRIRNKFHNSMYDKNYNLLHYAFNKFCVKFFFFVKLLMYLQVLWLTQSFFKFINFVTKERN